jgi:hypothetical protein
MFNILRRKLGHTAAYPHFLSLLHHCILLPCKFPEIFAFKKALKLSTTVKSTIILLAFKV